MKLGSKMSQYAVKISKRVFVEEDPKTSCQNYPNGKFTSYAECDKKFMRDTIEKAAPGLNLTPPWLTKILDLVTIEPVTAPRDISGGNIPENNYTANFTSEFITPKGHQNYKSKIFTLF